jgi:hypothetical protein
MAADLHSAVNFPKLLATAIDRESVPVCVRSENCSGRRYSRRGGMANATIIERLG